MTEETEKLLLDLVREILLEDHIEELTPELVSKAQKVADDMRSTALSVGWYRKD